MESSGLGWSSLPTTYEGSPRVPVWANLEETEGGNTGDQKMRVGRARVLAPVLTREFFFKAKSPLNYFVCIPCVFRARDVKCLELLRYM